MKENIPELRFPLFVGAYKKDQLQAYLKKVTYGFTNPMPIAEQGPYMLTAKDIIDGRICYESCRLTSVEAFNDLLTEKSRPIIGDVLLTKDGTLGRVAIVDKTNCCINQSVALLRPNKNIYSEYLIWLLSSVKYQGEMIRNAGGSTIKHIYITIVDKMVVSTPTLPEQQKIASFLSGVDKKIEKLTRKKELLELYKKGVMQKIFSQEIRFKPALSGVEGDDDGKEFPEWEEKRLGEIALFLKGKGISKDDVVIGGQLECIRYGELYTTYSEVISNVLSTTNVDSTDLVFSKKNDILIPSSGETHIDLATASCVDRDGIVIGGDVNIIRSKQNGIFLAYYLNNSRKHKIACLAQGSSVIHLYSTHLKSLKVFIPSNNEQDRVAFLLNNIDKKTEATQTQINKTQTFKKGLLQKMFV